jgi:hypothetical protein
MEVLSEKNETALGTSGSDHKPRVFAGHSARAVEATGACLPQEQRPTGESYVPPTASPPSTKRETLGASIAMRDSKKSAQRDYKRRYRRFPFEELLVVTRSDCDNESYTVGRTVDISEGGIGAFLVGRWMVGTLVSLEFRIPMTNSSLKTRGVQRSHCGRRCGFEFVALGPPESAAIRNICKNLKSLN